jgi:hypothetical protein
MQKLTIQLSERMTIEIDGNDAREIWPAAAFWNSLPTICPLCSAELTLEFKTPKTYKYYVLKCTGPTPHSVNLGQKVDGGTLYFDRSKDWEVFRAGQDHESEPAAARGTDLGTNLNLAEYANRNFRQATPPERSRTFGPVDPAVRADRIAEVRRKYSQCGTLGRFAHKKIDISDLDRMTDAQIAAIDAHLARIVHANG